MKQQIIIAAQNSSATTYGAYTGEITCEQLKDININWVIVGHSERRILYGESNEIVTKKVQRAQEVGFYTIICIGENLDQRKNNQTEEVLTQQLQGLLSAIDD